MDALKDQASKFTGGSSSGEQKQSSGQKEDYVDKGVESAEKKFGLNVSREQNEAMTDQAREMFEKQTGKDVPDKVSN
ncbi:hypothetical protein BDY21DRAFT_370111 [Lineolata rhizophorae]|uniref:Uncharacterized protein n=1 Tax=Lineolata rhizophorae TaxID=578093 RepID=A0A6A6P5Q4_9PEZI|nr:hypothetical protein BDY21DRAFT_370111 [Lineolata rhizophorae]